MHVLRGGGGGRLGGGGAAGGGAAGLLAAGRFGGASNRLMVSFMVSRSCKHASMQFGLKQVTLSKPEAEHERRHHGTHSRPNSAHVAGGAAYMRLKHLKKGLLNQVLQVSDDSHEASVQQGSHQALPQGKALGKALVRAIWGVQSPVEE